MLKEERDRKKVKLLPSKREDLMLLLEKTTVLRVNDVAATDLIESEFEKFLQMFPESMNKFRSKVNVTRTSYKSRTNNTYSKGITSSEVFTPDKSKVKKCFGSQTLSTKSSVKMSRNSGVSRDPSSKKKGFSFSKSC